MRLEEKITCFMEFFEQYNLAIVNITSQTSFYENPHRKTFGLIKLNIKLLLFFLWINNIIKMWFIITNIDSRFIQ